MESKKPLGFTYFIKTTIITTKQWGKIYLVNELLILEQENVLVFAQNNKICKKKKP